MIPLPEAWPALGHLVRHSRAVVIATDFDGTLVPMAETPNGVVVPARTRGVLAQLATNARFTVALVSGRRIADLDAFIDTTGLIVVGAHGFESRLPGGPVLRMCRDRETEASRLILSSLRRRLSHVRGVVIEDKQCVLAIHVRTVAAADHDDVLATVGRAVAPYRAFRVIRGPHVLEVRPLGGVNKGSALRRAMALTGVPDDAMCWYFGDEPADEDVFRALPAGSVTVRVAPPDGSSSAARYWLSGISGVLDTLDALNRCSRSEGVPTTFAASSRV